MLGESITRSLEKRRRYEQFIATQMAETDKEVKMHKERLELGLDPYVPLRKNK